MGIEKLSPTEAAAFDAQHLELAGTEKVLVDGDLRRAHELAWHVSGSDEEGIAYVGWLREHTLNLMRQPGYWTPVEALAESLLEHGKLSGARTRRVIDAERERWRQQAFGSRISSHLIVGKLSDR